MATLLIKRAQVVATMNDAQQELTDASIFIRDSRDRGGGTVRHPARHR